MKTVNPISTFAGYLLLFSIYMLSCSKASSPAPASEQDQARILLTKAPWKIQTESVDGVDQTALYQGFTIVFTATGYTTTNGGPIWPASGTWSFQGTSATSIARNDGTTVQIQVSSSSLIMKIDWASSTLGSGRLASTQGNNVFTMTN